MQRKQRGRFPAIDANPVWGRTQSKLRDAFVAGDSGMRLVRGLKSGERVFRRRGRVIRGRERVEGGDVRDGE